jgi:hypothetical protein
VVQAPPVPEKESKWNWSFNESNKQKVKLLSNNGTLRTIDCQTKIKQEYNNPHIKTNDSIGASIA